MAGRRPAVIGTAREAVQEGQIAMLIDDKDVLLRALLTQLSPLRVKALNALVGSHPAGTSSGMLAKRLDV
jgi:hypothetical protein